MVELLLFVLVLLQIVTLICGIVLVPRWIAKQKAELWQIVRQTVESEGDKPSPLAVFTDQLATLFAARIWQHIESRLRGAAGPEVREANKAAEAEIASSGPLAALAMAFLPKKAKIMLARNPQFLGALSGLMPGAKRGNAGSNGAPPANMRMEL